MYDDFEEANQYKNNHYYNCNYCNQIEEYEYYFTDLEGNIFCSEECMDAYNNLPIIPRI